MDVKVSNAAEILVFSANQDNTDEQRNQLISSIKIIADFIFDPNTEALNISLFTLLKTLQNADMNVWSLAEQTLIKIIKTYCVKYFDIILPEIWKGVKGSEVTFSIGLKKTKVKLEGRSRRTSLELFSYILPYIHLNSVKNFTSSIIKALIRISVQNEDQLLQESLAKHFAPIVRYQLSYCSLSELEQLIGIFICNATSQHGSVRRAAVSCITTILKLHKDKTKFINLIIKYSYNTLIYGNARDDIENSYVILSSNLDRKQLLGDLQSILDKSSATSLQGFLLLHKHLLRSSLDIMKESKFIFKNTILEELPILFNFACTCLQTIKENNTIVSNLELLDDILKYFCSELLKRLDDPHTQIGNLLNIFSQHLFNKESRISSQVLIMQSLCSLTNYMSIQFQQYIKDNFEAILNNFTSSDPLLRGQLYLFIGAFIKGWISCNEKIDWDIDVIGLLSKVLQSTYQDEATVSSKMACESISSVFDALLFSKYNRFAIVIIHHFLDMPMNTYPLVKSKVISLFAKIDFGIISLIEERLRYSHDNVTSKLNSFTQSLEIRVLNFIISFLNEEDTKLRQKSCECLVKMIPNLYRPKYLKDSKASTNNFNKLSIHRFSELKRTKVQCKENIYFLLSHVIPYINQYNSGSFMKGFFYFLRILLENENYLQINFIDIILEQLTCYSNVLDLETQLDITILVSYIVAPKKEELTDYNNILFTHVLKLLNIFYHIIGGYHSSTHKFKVGRGSLKGSIQDHPLYISMWERLSDLYRISLSTLNTTIYDDYLYHTLASMDRMIVSLGHLIIPYIDELILYSTRFFDIYPEKIVDILYSIAKSTLSDSLNSKGTERSKILASFERLFSKCVAKYSQVLCINIKLKILSLIHLLIKEGFNYKATDKDFAFLKLLHHQLIRGTQEYIKTKDIGSSDKQEKSSLVATHTQAAEVSIFQLCVVLELHVLKNIPITGLPLSSFDIPLIVKTAFEASWCISNRYDAYSGLVDIFFCRSEKMEESNNSINKDVFKEEVIPKIKTIIIENILELFPQPNSDDLIVHIFRYLKGSPEIDMLSIKLLKLIQDLLSKKEKYSLVTLMDAIEFYNLFRVIDLIPQHLLTCENVFSCFENIKEERDLNLMCLLSHIISRIEPEEILKDKEYIFKILTNNICNAVKIFNNIQSKAIFIGMLDSILIILHNFLVLTHDDVTQYFNTFLNDDIIANQIINQLIDSSHISIILKMCDIALSIGSSNFLLKIITKLNKLNLWYREIILGVALPHYIRLVSDNSDIIKELICDNSYLELIIEFIDDPNVLSILKKLNSLKLEDNIIAFVKEKMQLNDNLTSNYIHKLLALITHVKPSKELIIILIETFMVTPFLSVVLSCEKFILRYLDRFNLFEFTSLTDEIILDIVEQYKDILRPNFVKKVRDINWLMFSPSSEKQQFSISHSLQENFLSLTPQDIYSILRHGPTEKPKIINNVNKIIFNWIIDKRIDPTKLMTLRSAEDVQKEYKGLLPFEQLENDDSQSEDDHEEFLTFNFDSQKAFDDYNYNENKEYQYSITEWWSTIDMIKAISLSLYRFSEWSDKFTVDSYSLSGVLIELALYVLDMTSYFYYNAIDYISTFEIIHVISYLKYLFTNFEITLEKIMDEEKLKSLIYKIYNLYFIVHGTNSKIELTEGTYDKVTDILQFFWEYLRNRHWDSFHFEHHDTSIIEEHYYSLIKSLAQSSASLENEIYLFQDNPINYDYNNEPIDILEKFLYLINTIPPVFPETFMKIWKQILIGIDPKSKILPIATSEKIKVLSIRALTSLLYRVLINLDNVFTIGNGPKDRLTYIPIIKTSPMKENLIYLWKGLNLSSLIDEYIDFLMPHLLQFLYYTTTEPSLGKECLKSIVILSDFLVLNQRNNLLAFFNDNLENLQDEDDPFIKEYMVLGLTKLLTITWASINSDAELLINISQKLVLILRNFISSQNLRRNDIPLSEKPIIPVTRSMILFALNYVLQDKRIFNFSIEPTIYPFLKKLLDREVKIMYETRTSHLMMLNLATKSPSMLVKHLAKSCISLLSSSHEKSY